MSRLGTTEVTLSLLLLLGELLLSLFMSGLVDSYTSEKHQYDQDLLFVVDEEVMDQYVKCKICCSLS